MLRRVWVTRARPGADRTADRLTVLGFIPLVVPLLEIRARVVDLDLVGVQALAFTSPNGVAAFAALSEARALPVFAVGDTTAGAARRAGFPEVRSAGGDVDALAALIRQEGRGLSILHAGAAEPAGDLAGAVGDEADLRAVPVYGAHETGAVPPPDWDAVLFHSPRAARALRGVPSGRVAVTLSQAVAASLAGRGFGEIRIAARPTEAALFEALAAEAPTTLGKPRPAV